MDWTSEMDALNKTTLAAFGREITYFPQSSVPVTVRAILEATRQSQENSPGVFAVVFLRLADLSALPQCGDAVVVGAATYKVFNVEVDGQGGVTLGLHQV